MKVVVLCGGMGTRLKRETEFMPKPMVKIGDKPILWHIMKIYSHYGFDDFILCLGYKGEIIKEYFYHYEIMANDFQVVLGKESGVEVFHNHSERDWRITLAETGERSLKGARIKRIENYVDTDDLMVTYGDGVSDIDVSELVKFHRDHGRIATLTGVKPLSRFGEIQTEGQRVVEFREKPQSDEGLINGGFFVFKKEIFSYLSDDDQCDLEFGVLEALANEGQLMVYRHGGFWACMDTSRDMEYLNRLWEKGESRWKVW